MAIWIIFMAIWDIVLPFSTLCVHLVHFSGFGVMHQEKSGNPELHMYNGRAVRSRQERFSKWKKIFLL
jgi:hypothetical protein